MHWGLQVNEILSSGEIARPRAGAKGGALRRGANGSEPLRLVKRTEGVTFEMASRRGSRA